MPEIRLKSLAFNYNIRANGAWAPRRLKHLSLAVFSGLVPLSIFSYQQIPEMTMILPYTLAFTMPGPMELFFISMVVIVLFGAKRLPELARSLGKSAVEFKKARREFENEIRDSTGGELTLEDNDDSRADEAQPANTGVPVGAQGNKTRPDQ